MTGCPATGVVCIVAITRESTPCCCNTIRSFACRKRRHSVGAHVIHNQLGATPARVMAITSSTRTAPANWRPICCSMIARFLASA